MKRLNGQQGFTLTELIVVISVIGILVTVIATVVINNLQAIARENNRAELIRSSQLGLDLITENARLGSNAKTSNRWPDMNAPAAAGGDYFSWQSDAQTLIVSSPVVDTSGNIVFLDTTQYVPETNEEVYYLKDRTIHRRIIAASGVANNRRKTTCPDDRTSATCRADAKIMDNVDSIEFKYFDVQGNEVVPANARSVQVTVNVSLKSTGGNLNSKLVTRMVFRNV